MIRCGLPLLFLLVCLPIPLAAEFRTFTNDFGDEIEAELVELKENETLVTLKLRSGNKIDARVTAFSQKDQKLIVSATTLTADFSDRDKTVLESDPFRLRLYEYDSSYFVR